LLVLIRLANGCPHSHCRKNPGWAAVGASNEARNYAGQTVIGRWKSQDDYVRSCDPLCFDVP